MIFSALNRLEPLCLLLLVNAGIVKGFECSAGCNPDNGFCEKPGECRCKAGWQGETCGQCVPFPGCLHGTCQTPWQCICEDGWIGSQCDIDTRSCSSKPCLNNATCTETSEGKHQCICAQGYTGENCHLKMGSCLTNGSPCQNGGTCTDGDGQIDRPACLCPSGFAGDFCEIDVDDCEPNPCANGGTCTDHGAGYVCTCLAGFTGPTCNRTTPACVSSACLNGGTCLGQWARGVRCLCPPGFVGPTCGQRRPQPAHLSTGTSGSRRTAQRYGVPSHEFHRLARPSERELLKIAMKEAGHGPSPLVTRSQVICFAVLGLLTCLVVLGTTGIIFFNRCESWMANAKYSQLVRQRRDSLLRSKDGEDRSLNIILPEKIKLTPYGNHYTSI